MKCMILQKKNATQIRKIIKNKYNGVNLNIRSIFKFMRYIRKSIACYIKNIYNTIDISTLNGNNNYAIDESLFTHINNENLWVIGIVDTGNNFRCNISKIRNNIYLKKFIEKYIKKGNNIISDGWPGYSFLNNINSGYTHISYNHGAGNWGIGVYSTSHIEGMWSSLKNYIKNIYYSIPSKGFYYYLKEAEFRFMNRNKNNKEILLIMQKIFKFNYINNNFNFHSILYLNNLD